MTFASLKIRIKNILRRIVATGFYLSGVHKFLHRGKVLILMYHRVVRDDDECIPYIQPGMYVTESTFDCHMGFIKKHYRVLSLQQLLDGWKSGGLDKNRKYCVVTFDDGWLDNYLHAYPVLRKYDIPATIFLVTSYIGTDHWFWPEQLSYLLKTKGVDGLLGAIRNASETHVETDDVILAMQSCLEVHRGSDTRTVIDAVTERIKPFSTEAIERALAELYQGCGLAPQEGRALLNWAEATEMSQHGVSFGSHTCSHKILTNIPTPEVKKELEESMQVLKGKGVGFVPVFCYPNGNNTDEIQKLVECCGYQAAVSTKFGFETNATNGYFSLHRIGVHNDVAFSVPLFAFQLSGFQHLKRKMKLA